MKKAFTLIELLISIIILSIIMLFLYKSYASVNRTNVFHQEKAKEILGLELKKKIMFLDFALGSDIKVLNQEKNEDIVFLQTTNSIHNRFNPYVAYVIAESKLYRLESLTIFREYPLSSEVEFSFECFGDVDGFRAYKSQDDEQNSYLLHVDFKNEKDILIKTKVLNES